MTVNLASRLSALLLAGAIVVTGWTSTLGVPHSANRSAPIVATR